MSGVPTVEWPPFKPLPPKLQYYGKHFSDRFLGPQSTLDKHHVRALLSLLRCFASNSTTRDNTAVMVMHPAAGSMGVLCCLPFAIGGAVERETISTETINVKASVLVITPGLHALRLLEEHLLHDPFLVRKGILTPADREYNYTVHTVRNIYSVTQLQSCQFDIVLTSSQPWDTQGNVGKGEKEEGELPTFRDLPDDVFSLVLVDHAHLIPVTQWEEIVDKFRPGGTRIVFFTATPTIKAGHDVVTPTPKKDCEANFGVTITTEFGSGGWYGGGGTAERLAISGHTYRMTRVDAIQERVIRDMQLSSLGLTDELSDTEKRVYVKAVLMEVKKCLRTKNERSPLPVPYTHTAVVLTRDEVDSEEVRDLCLTDLEWPEKSVKIIRSDHTHQKSTEQAVQQVHQGQYDLIIIDQGFLGVFNHPAISVGAIVTKVRSPILFEHFVSRILGVMKVEDFNTKANLITHKYFEQRELFSRYMSPTIPEREIVAIDKLAD